MINIKLYRQGCPYSSIGPHLLFPQYMLFKRILIHKLSNKIMIVSDAHNFASRLSRDMEQINRERQLHIEKLSSGVKVMKSTDDVGALSSRINQTRK